MVVNPRMSLRAEQAAQTRGRIIRAATEVFEERGFTGTRFEDVAERAGVAVPTVYKAFTNKANLLIAAVELAMSGTDVGGPLEAQSWFKEQLDEPDPARQLQLIARNARQLYERAGRLLDVLRAAAPLDAQLGNTWDEIAAQRVTRSRQSASRLMTKARNRARLSRNDAALTLLSLTEPAVFSAYAASGRPAAKYEQWLADILTRVLLH